jgi:hypothetical protein
MMEFETRSSRVRGEVRSGTNGEVKGIDSGRRGAEVWGRMSEIVTFVGDSGCG